jgi:hypothetical protein
MSTLADKVVALHQSLAKARLPHAFGGALALAWCTQRARGTIDIDINVFVGRDRVDELLAALPAAIAAPADDSLEREGQTRLWWDTTPVDVFLNTTKYHEDLALRCRVERFNGDDIPFLSCTDLAVFKAFFDRTKDWADLEEMAIAGTLDRQRVVGVAAEYLGADDPRIAKVLALPTAD